MAGLGEWLSNPLAAMFSSVTGGTEAPGAPAAPGADTLNGIERLATDHPFLTAAALALADHKVNDRGLFGSVATFLAARQVLKGDDDGLLGIAGKVWLANEFKNVTQKVVPGEGTTDTVAGLGAGILSYMQMSGIGNNVDRRQAALAPG